MNLSDLCGDTNNELASKAAIVSPLQIFIFLQRHDSLPSTSIFVSLFPNTRLGLLSRAPDARIRRPGHRVFLSLLALVACSFLGWTHSIDAADLPSEGQVLDLRAKELESAPIEMDEGWSLHPETPSLPSDSSPGWQPLEHTFSQPGMAPPPDNAIAWYRRVIEVSSDWVDRPIALRLEHPGASRVFVNGLPVASFGHPSANSELETIRDPSGIPIVVTFPKPGRNTLTLHYSCSAVADGRWAPWLTVHRGAGFRARLDLPERANQEIFQTRQLESILNIGGGAMALGFAILHGLIYAFHRRHRGNLWFCLFSLCMAANGFLDIILTWGSWGLLGWTLFRGLILVSASGLILFLVLFLATLRQPKTPRYGFLLAAGLAPALVFFYVPTLRPAFTAIFLSWLVASGALALWACLDALRHRVEGAGVLLISALGWIVMIWAQAAKGQVPVAQEALGFGLGISLILGGASVFLARRIAHEGRQLETLTTELEDRVRIRTAELRRSEQAALAASRAKSAFLATMSHEIRTPMNAIIGFAELLNSPALPAKERDMVQTLLRSALSLLHLIDEVLDLSRIESGRLEVDHRAVDVHLLARQVVELFEPQAQRADIELRLLLDSAKPLEIYGDPLRLRQVLVNLVGNALKFTAQGQVSVSAQPIPSDRPQSLRFTVEDTGVGIPEKVRQQIFEPFFQVDSSSTRHHGGAGLGLAICQRLVHSMGGQLQVDSTVGQGSTFWFEIPFEDVSTQAQNVLQAEADSNPPRAQTGASRPVDSDIESSVKIHQLRILVADDNETNRLVTDAMLASLGCKADVVQNGAEVLQALGEQTYDVLLLDLHMPDMDGLETAHIIQTLHPYADRPLLVAFTASVHLEDRERCLNAGLDAFLGKPVQQDDMVSILEMASDRKRLEHPAPGALHSGSMKGSPG